MDTNKFKFSNTESSAINKAFSHLEKCFKHKDLKPIKTVIIKQLRQLSEKKTQ